MPDGSQTELFHQRQDASNDAPHALGVGMQAIRQAQPPHQGHVFQEKRIVQHAGPLPQPVEHAPERRLVIRSQVRRRIHAAEQHGDMPSPPVDPGWRSGSPPCPSDQAPRSPSFAPSSTIAASDAVADRPVKPSTAAGGGVAGYGGIDDGDLAPPRLQAPAATASGTRPHAPGHTQPTTNRPAPATEAAPPNADAVIANTIAMTHQPFCHRPAPQYRVCMDTIPLSPLVNPAGADQGPDPDRAVRRRTG